MGSAGTFPVSCKSCIVYVSVKSPYQTFLLTYSVCTFMDPVGPHRQSGIDCSLFVFDRPVCASVPEGVATLSASYLDSQHTPLAL